MVRDMEPDVTRMRQAAGGVTPRPPILPTGSRATLKVPFREAHHVTGQIVAKAAAARRSPR